MCRRQQPKPAIDDVPGSVLPIGGNVRRKRDDSCDATPAYGFAVLDEGLSESVVNADCIFTHAKQARVTSAEPLYGL